MKTPGWMLIFIILVMAFGSCAKEERETVIALVGAASKPAMEEAIQAFREKTGVQVYANYGGSGTLLSQIELSKSGDLYIPGSPDFMAKAGKKGVIDPAKAEIIAYLIPVVAVQKGNPKDLKSLADLARPGIKVGIGNPEAVCLGLYAIELIDYNRLLADIMKNVVTYAESCEKTAALLSLKQVDAIIGWHVFHDWDPDNIDVVYLEKEQLPRIAYIPAALTAYAKQKEQAQKFLDYLVSAQGGEIFSRWGYIATEEEARKFAPQAEIGGEYTLPDSYQELIK